MRFESAGQFGQAVQDYALKYEKAIKSTKSGEKNIEVRPARNKQASSKWLARHYKETLREKPDWNVLEMQRDIDKKFVISVSKNVCYRARARALKKVYRHGLFSTIVERHIRLKRMFVGFDALKEGFLGGCRHVISLDECFLKSKVGGQLLSAVGRDGYN
ncbi:hypothetical protein Cni_G02160 [Canna indica]|uniref:Transposase n=1 Tax=Canna indica TaxID=4628 RepID=A0AAQ3JPK6_9LILI|nr:hypothetical protein Cni_G02160 [Canna indica]